MSIMMFFDHCNYRIPHLLCQVPNRGKTGRRGPWLEAAFYSEVWHLVFSQLLEYNPGCRDDGAMLSVCRLRHRKHYVTSEQKKGSTS